MLLAGIRFLCDIAYCASMDIIFFILIDFVAKTLLRDASSEAEKQQIWLLESLALFLLCLPVYLLDHRPYILASLAVVTLLYTQLRGRLSLSQLWTNLTTRWDEFQQHEESLEQLSARQNTPPPQQTVPPGVPQQQQYMQWPPPVMYWEGQGQGQNEYMLPAEPWYPEDTGKNKDPEKNEQPKMEGHHQLRYRGPPVSTRPPVIVSQAGQPVFTSAAYSNNNPQLKQHHSMGLSTYTPVIPRMNLARRGIHSPTSTTPMKQPTPTPTFKSKVLSAFGINPYSKTPPGLRNSGQNLCFMNSVLQCLAHTPGVLDAMAVHGSNNNLTAQQVALLSSFRDLVQRLVVEPGTSEERVVDTQPFRLSAASFPHSLVAHPAGAQGQQDAAEFLMWLLDTLHSLLNTNGKKASKGPDGEPVKPKVAAYSGITLNILKFIYGDLTPSRIEGLKQACRKEIELASGLDNDSYAEPIQRLSDLEWLTYKQKNSSVVDNLFTGQLVEAQHCISCNHISVNIQPFNILPVAVVEPRSVSGLVYIEDCFAKFGTTEDLFGPDGLRCDNCNKKRLHSTPVPGVKPTSPVSSSSRMQGVTPSSPVVTNNGGVGGLLHMHKQRLIGSDSALNSTLGQTIMMSPIANSGEIMNDSGFQDNQFRTSTPVHNPHIPVRVTDGQRRSLLRQLPECLTVQLLRFSYSNGMASKLHKQVSIPLINLDLTQIIYDKVTQREDLTAPVTSFLYNLYGLCLHVGGNSTTHGHYVSYALCSNGRWYKFNDECVTEVNMEYELSTKYVRENAYLLLYKRHF